MATKEMRICDVTGSTKDVRRVRTIMTYMDDNGIADDTIEMYEADMTPKSIERWKKFIERGCTPPAPRATKGGAK